MACVLFSRPNHDDIVAYLHEYSKELVELSRSLNHKTLNKEQNQATKSIILNLINNYKPNLIMLNGHGSPDCVCGHDNEIIIHANENAQVLKNSITYSFSCSSAANLGQASIKNGAICFIGYEEDFALGKDPERETTPSKDKIAKLFLGPSNLLFISLLNGKTAKESVEKAKRAMFKNVEYLNSTETFLNASYYAPYLFGNYLSLVIHGDENSSID